MRIVQCSSEKPMGMMLLGFFYILFVLRTTYELVLEPDCQVIIFPDKVIHFYGIYLQLGRWSANFMVRSHKCLEAR